MARFVKIITYANGVLFESEADEQKPGHIFIGVAGHFLFKKE